MEKITQKEFDERMRQMSVRHKTIRLQRTVKAAELQSMIDDLQDNIHTLMGKVAEYKADLRQHHIDTMRLDLDFRAERQTLIDNSEIIIVEPQQHFDYVD